MKTDELLTRIAAALRTEIAPAVGDEFPRTQAYMAAVVLERVAGEVALGSVHADADAADATELHRTLVSSLVDAPAEVTAALGRFGEAATIGATGPLIDALYAWESDVAAAQGALGEIRRCLRRDIDRRMEIAT